MGKDKRFNTKFHVGKRKSFIPCHLQDKSDGEGKNAQTADASHTCGFTIQRDRLAYARQCHIWC